MPLKCNLKYFLQFYYNKTIRVKKDNFFILLSTIVFYYNDKKLSPQRKCVSDKHSKHYHKP